MSKAKCPYCGSSHLTTMVDDYRFRCMDCEMMFDTQDIQLEDIRHRISRVLSANFATENNPYPCDMELGEWCVDKGSGELELIYPHLVSIFQTEDGIICFTLAEMDGICEFDVMPILDLQDIADAIC